MKQKRVMLYPVRPNNVPPVSVIQREATVRLLRSLGRLSTSFEVEVDRDSPAARKLRAAGYTSHPSQASWDVSKGSLAFTGTVTAEAIALLAGSCPESPDQIWPWQELSLLRGPKLLLHAMDYGEHVQCMPQG